MRLLIERGTLPRSFLCPSERTQCARGLSHAQTINRAPKAARTPHGGRKGRGGIIGGRGKREGEKPRRKGNPEKTPRLLPAEIHARPASHAAPAPRRDPRKQDQIPAPLPSPTRPRAIPSTRAPTIPLRPFSLFRAHLPGHGGRGKGGDYRGGYGERGKKGPLSLTLLSISPFSGYSTFILPSVPLFHSLLHHNRQNKYAGKKGGVLAHLPGYDGYERTPASIKTDQKHNRGSRGVGRAKGQGGAEARARRGWSMAGSTLHQIKVASNIDLTQLWKRLEAQGAPKRGSTRPRGGG